MITRYFDATIDGHQRIQVVKADTNADSFPDVHGLEKPREIDKGDLPADFSSWKQYDAFAYTDAAVYVMSRDGD